MKIILILLSLVMTATPSSGQDKTGTVSSPDSLLYRMMQIEQAPVGKFNSLSIFHNDLASSVISKDLPPFPLLDSLFGTIRSSALGIAQARKSYAMIIEESLSRNELHSDKPVDGKTDQDLLQNGELKIQQMEQGLREFYEALGKYDSLLEINNVRRIPTLSFADTLGQYLIQYDDSLAHMSALLAKCKKSHDLFYGSARDKLFWKDYNKISEMEAMLKTFRQMMIQLENSQSRFYSANPEDYFFTGKMTAPRIDIMTSIDQLVQMNLLISDFRLTDRSFHQHLGETE